MTEQAALKPLDFIGSSREDLKEFPDEVKQDIGYALFEAQKGQKSEAAKPLKGFGGTGVLEIIERFDGDTYRAVYGEVSRSRLRVALLSKEIQEWHQDAAARHRADSAAIESGGRGLPGALSARWIDHEHKRENSQRKRQRLCGHRRRAPGTGAGAHPGHVSYYRTD